MPINELRKPGAKMSLKEALERVEKLKRMAASSNPHEAAVAAARLKAFDVDAARTPQPKDAETGPATRPETGESGPQKVEVLDELPVIPYKDLGELEVEQPPETSSVNWDVLHAELLERAQQIGANAIIDIQIKGTIQQKILTGTALKYLSPQEILDIQAANKLDDDEKAYYEAQKERRDEDWAPPVG